MTSDLTIEPLTPFIGAEIIGVDLKVVTQEQVAGAVRFLAADSAASYITGQVLQVDGGMVMA